MPSLKASRFGLAQIKQAIAQRGGRLGDDSWLVAASSILEPTGHWCSGGPYAYGCSEPTWERFLQGKAIRADSFVAFCQVLGVDPAQISEGPTSRHEDWGDAPDVPALYGRDGELSTLKRWILTERCRLIAIVGLAGSGKTQLVRGGIGKTDLSLELAHRVQSEFQSVIWRRLLNAPPLKVLMSTWIGFLSHQQAVLSPTLEEQMAQLLHYLRQQRCLLILDNIESILGSGATGRYRPGFEAYGTLFRCIGEAEHSSCLLLTSRENPQDLEAMEGVRPVRVLQLGGLASDAAQQIFCDIGRAHGADFCGSDSDWQQLIRSYSGNPLALEVVARHILRRFDGDIAAFLRQNAIVFGKIREVLDWHFERLSAAEQELLYWLAINREPVSIAELQQDVLSSVAQKQVAATLDSLERQLPLEKSDGRYTLQPVLIEYLTERFIQCIGQELRTGKLHWFNTHALIKAFAKDYVRESQIRLILQPVVDELTAALGATQHENLEQLLKSILEILKLNYPHHPGYAAGNLLNLLCHTGIDISGYDFSRLSLRQAYLQGMRLYNVNFSHCAITQLRFTQSFGGVHSLAFSPDNSLLAMGDSNGDIRLVHLPDEQQRLLLRGHGKSLWVAAVAFSPDGSVLASGSFDRTVKLWDVQTGQCLRTLAGHTNWIWTVAFSPDGQTIASGGDDQTARLWNRHTGECRILEGHQGWVWAVAFSPQGDVLATGGYDHTIRFWQVQTGQCVQVLTGHEQSVWSLAFSPDGQTLASSSLDYTVKLWSVTTGVCRHTLRGHRKEVRSVAFSADGNTVASGSFDQTVRLWDAATGECRQTLQGHANGIRTLAFSLDGQLLASGDNYQIVKVWQVKTGHCLKTWQGYSNWVWGIAFSPDGQTLASASLDQKVRLWHTGTGQLTHVLQGHSDWVWAVAFSPDGQTLASSCDDETIRLWDTASGQCQRILQGHRQGGVWTVDFHPSGQWLASGGQDGTVRIWQVKTGTCVQQFQGHSNWIWSVRFSANGQRLVSSSDDRTIKVWDTSTGSCIQTIHENLGKVMAMALCPDGQTILSGGDDGLVQLWDITTGHCLRSFAGHTQWVLAVAISPDGQTLASASADETVRIWDLPTGGCQQVLRGHGNWVRSLTFAPEGRRLASCGSDGTIQLWQMPTGKALMTLQPKRPYEGIIITGMTGLSPAQRETLVGLGAIE